MSLTSDLVAQVRALTPIDQREEASIAATLERLSRPGDPYDEFGDEHHVTASAFVLSSRGVILHRHKRLGIWVQPGGHVDRGEDPPGAALRETLEETGLVVEHTRPVTLLHVDVHAGPRGHTHYDLRYVLLARPLDPAPPAGESPDVYWFDLARAKERCEATMVAAIEKLESSAPRWTMRD